ncbi:phosphoserine transaminase [Ochrobactrum vermis]|uniref:phosphoserine transaminase n=1 Tax=Ochrobactrum vermis TaxID=1827297 RepID=A0ABU8PNE5_9HYPH|nr:phosphoserine transaminase [Ochrobactrum vermis]PQZ24383.1 phosphoserine transaminase [Ochrobactrum vermis]
MIALTTKHVSKSNQVSSHVSKPKVRPRNPHFSSGPSAKRIGWHLSVLDDALIGRSHRSQLGKAKLAEVIERTRAILGVPDDYRIAIVPGSDTGAMEMAMWSLLGSRGIDVLAWESFGKEWVTDITSQLSITDTRTFVADYGKLPDLGQCDASRDIVFTWNGTTSGVRVPNGDWISDDRTGLTICDATSAAFAMALPWSKLDVVTWSWQKVLGGEGAHGMLVLGPRAVKRLEAQAPAWPIPKLFRMTKNGKLIDRLFTGETINTPSLLAVEDAIVGLDWAEKIGGLPELTRRCEANLATVTDWVSRSRWAAFLAERPETRSCTALCLRIIAPEIEMLDVTDLKRFVAEMVWLLDLEGVAYDIGSYHAAPVGLRLWGGATVENADMEAVLPWLDWAFEVTRLAWNLGEEARFRGPA